MSLTRMPNRNTNCYSQCHNRTPLFHWLCFYGIWLLEVHRQSCFNTSWKGTWGLRYCGIELFFKRYFGNFDFNVRLAVLVFSSFPNMLEM